MNFRTKLITSLIAAVAAATPLLATTTAGAASTQPKVTAVWARTSTGSTGAVYLTMSGTGKADKLIAASAPKSVTKKAQLHRTMMGSGDLMSMAPVKAIAVPAWGTVKLKPGGYHIMLIGLRKPLEAGASFPLTLTFARSGKQTVTVKVRKS